MSTIVSKIPADQSVSGWYGMLPPPPPAKVLESDIQADWVIIGAGFAGLSAAHRLHKQAQGERVVVVDAQRVGWGASGRNSGFMIDLPHNLQSDDYSGEGGQDHNEIAMNRFAIRYAKSLIEEYGLEDSAADIGKINAASDQRGLDALTHYSGHLQKMGEPFSTLDRESLREITGTDYYKGGIHTPGCMLIQPAGYIRGVAAGLGQSLSIFENTAAVKLETGKSGMLHQVVTSGGTITCKNIILTVNGHLESFGYYRRRLMPVFLYASMTRVLTDTEQKRLGGQTEWGITPANPLGSSVRRLRQGRILMRNHITYNPKLESTDEQLARASLRHDDSYRRRFPMVADVPMEFRWSGHLCLSRNSVPVFGEIEKGVFAACCQNGLGAAKGTLHGILIADHALGLQDGETQSMLKSLLSVAQPKKLYPEPFMNIGANAYLWWSQKRAGRDI